MVSLESENGISYENIGYISFFSLFILYIMYLFLQYLVIFLNKSSSKMILIN